MLAMGQAGQIDGGLCKLRRHRGKLSSWKPAVGQDDVPVNVINATSRLGWLYRYLASGPCEARSLLPVLRTRTRTIRAGGLSC
jgi:hypothetical protein